MRLRKEAMTTTSVPPFFLSLTFLVEMKPRLRRRQRQTHADDVAWSPVVGLTSPKAQDRTCDLGFVFDVDGDDGGKMKSLSFALSPRTLSLSFSFLSLRDSLGSDVRPPQVLRVGDPHDHRGPLAVSRGLDLGLAQRRHDGEEEGCVESRRRRRRRRCIFVQAQKRAPGNSSAPLSFLAPGQNERKTEDVVSQRENWMNASQ